MIELNLLPDIKQEFVHAKRQKRLVVVAMILTSIVSVAVVVLLGVYAFVAQPVRQNLADQSIKDLSEDLKEKKTLVRDLTIQNQISSINELHEQKTTYGRLLDYLKILNPEQPNNVSISKATIATVEGEGTLSLEGTTKNFEAIAVFKDTLKNAKLEYKDPETGDKVKTNLFSSVVMTDAGLGQDSGGNQVASFKATLIYDQNTFAWAVKNPKVTVPNKKTNQSASSASVFSETPATKEAQ